MLTIHQANGRGPRVDEAAQARAVRRVAELRRLDPHLVDAMADPDNLYPNGRPRFQRVAQQLGRTVAQVKQDLDALRVAVGA